MQTLSLIEGDLPNEGSEPPEVLIDEGIQHFLGWEVGEVQGIRFGSQLVEFKISGITGRDSQNRLLSSSGFSF